MRVAMDPATLQQINQVNAMEDASNAEQFRVWFTYIVFSWHWWLDLALVRCYLGSSGSSYTTEKIRSAFYVRGSLLR